MAGERAWSLFYQAGERGGAGNKRALAISADNSRPAVWCATSGSGLARVTMDDLFGAIVSRLDIEQGLPSQRVFAVISERVADGTESVIIGTNRGVVR